MPANTCWRKCWRVTVTSVTSLNVAVAKPSRRRQQHRGQCLLGGQPAAGSSASVYDCVAGTPSNPGRLGGLGRRRVRNRGYPPGHSFHSGPRWVPFAVHVGGGSSWPARRAVPVWTILSVPHTAANTRVVICSGRTTCRWAPLRGRCRGQPAVDWSLTGWAVYGRRSVPEPDRGTQVNLGRRVGCGRVILASRSASPGSGISSTTAANPAAASAAWA